MFRPGDIGFVLNNSWTSKIISKIMGSQWSHSFIFVGYIDNVPMILETTDFEVIIAPLSDYMDGRPIAVFRNNTLNDNERKQVAKRSYENIKTVYGYLQLFSLGIRRLFKKFGIKINNFFRQGIVCCGAAAYGYTGTKTNIGNIDPENMDTEEFYQIILNSTEWDIVHTSKKLKEKVGKK